MAASNKWMLVLQRVSGDDSDHHMGPQPQLSFEDIEMPVGAGLLERQHRELSLSCPARLVNLGQRCLVSPSPMAEADSLRCSTMW